jgi:hypothetical protein
MADLINATIFVNMSEHFYQHLKVSSAQLTLAAALVLISCNPSPHFADTRFAQSVASQNTQSEAPIFRLFRLDGTFSEELTPKSKSISKPSSPRFSLVSARLENDGMGAVARIRTTLTISNEDSTLRITEVEWRLDIFDASIGNASNRIIQSEKINIYSGETANVSARFGGILPDRMVILMQLVRVSFAEGPSWSAPGECSLENDLRTVLCESK